jgi:hypothetical protein
MVSQCVIETWYEILIVLLCETDLLLVNRQDIKLVDVNLSAPVRSAFHGIAHVHEFVVNSWNLIFACRSFPKQAIKTEERKSK